MKNSFEMNVFGLALGTYMTIQIVFLTYPFLSLMGTKQTIIATFIALFFPYISKNKRIILSLLSPIKSGLAFIISLPTLRDFTIILERFDEWQIYTFGDTSINLKWDDPKILFLLVFSLISFYFIEPFIFEKIYEKIGLYDKIPFTRFCEKGDTK